MSDIDGTRRPLSTVCILRGGSPSKPRTAGLPRRDRRRHHVRLGPSRHETKSPGASRSWWHISSEQQVHPEFPSAGLDNRARERRERRRSRSDLCQVGAAAARSLGARVSRQATVSGGPEYDSHTAPLAIDPQKKNPGGLGSAGAVNHQSDTPGDKWGDNPMAPAYLGNRQITGSLPHHYGPKTDRRTPTAPVMSHNVQRARWDYCQLNAIGAPLTSIWWAAPQLGLRPRQQIKNGRGNR
jgi:hypothetical protein